MALIEYTVFGTVDKVQIAIDRLKHFEPPDGYYLAFSGGKGPAYSLTKMCWGPDEAEARKTYHRLWPNSGVPVTGEDLRAAADAVLAGRQVPAEQKPSIGCNIKWKPGNEPDYFAS